VCEGQALGLQTDSKISDIIRDSIQKKQQLSVSEEIRICIRRNLYPYLYLKNFNGYGYGLAITYP
jgi:hypothetical protein